MTLNILTYYKMTRQEQNKYIISIIDNVINEN